MRNFLPKEADFEVEILIKRHLVALIDKKGHNFKLTFWHSFIYRSKAKDEFKCQKNRILAL